MRPQGPQSGTGGRPHGGVDGDEIGWAPGYDDAVIIPQIVGGVVEFAPVRDGLPMVKARISWDGDQIGRTLVVLLDTGCSTMLISSEFVFSHGVPWVKRDRRAPLVDAGGGLLEGSGEAHSLPMKLHFGSHVTRERFDLLPMKGQPYQAIIPFWWLAKHRVTNLYECRNDASVRAKFNRPSCSHCTSAQADEITFEWDESILDPAYEGIVGQCGVVTAAADHAPATPGTVVAGLPEIYSEYSKVFSEETARALPPNRDCDHAIELLPGKQPPFGPIYSLSELELQALREYLKEMLDSGKIRPSKSPAGAPILFVPKAHGRGLRLCVDYRGLNRVTVMNRYPLPLISELKDRVQGAKIFSRIDLKNGYNLIRIKPGDEWKTAFRTRYGLFEYLVMPMGLTNAPATFQAYIGNLLKDLVDIGVLVYIDDILIYSETMEEHERLVKEVLRRLQDNGLAAAPDKCEFHKSKLAFLGFIISDQGVEMSEDKLREIRDWETPKNVKDVQAFLGFANFYRRFIKDYSRIAKPLTDLTKSGITFEWPIECELAFRSLKEAFTQAPILKHFDPELPIQIEADASDFALGAVLSQYHEPRWHPVAYHSRKMTPAELNYEIYDKELLAIVEVFKEWRRYCEGAKHQISVYSDHRNLEWFVTNKARNRRQARWAMETMQYDFKIHYRKGSANGKADALSRRSEYRPKGGDGDELLPTHFVLKPDHLDQDSLSHRPLAIAAVALCAATLAPFADEFKARVREAAQKDSEYLRKIELARAGEAGDNVGTEDGLLTYKLRLWIPEDEELRLEIAKTEHDVQTAGHLGGGKTHELLSRNFYWPKMEAWVQDFVSSCDVCQRVKAARHGRYGKLLPLESPYKPWTSISMDFITELPKSDGFTSIWVIVDRFTKMAHFIPLKPPATARDLARIFVREIWRLHGIPSEIVSDRDSRFTSNFWQSLLELLSIKSKMSTAFRPQTDGQTERVNQTLEAFLRAFCCKDQSDWASLLPWAEYCYNNSATSATGMTPFYANYGYHPVTNWPGDEEPRNPTSINYVHWMKGVHEGICKRLKATRERMGQWYDKNKVEAPKFEPGDRVMLDARHVKTKRPSKKLDFKSIGPFTIKRVIKDIACELDLPDEWKIHPVFHISLLEPYRTARISGRPEMTQEATQQAVAEVEVESDDDPEGHFPVESIMDSRKRNSKVRYLIKWKDYPAREDWTWEPFENLSHCQETLREFHAAWPRKPRDRRFRG